MAVGAVLVLGTGGFVWTEGWTAWDAFYFTVVTITTVGYGDYGLSDHGRALAVVVMLVGIATLTYTAGEFIRRAIALGMDTERHMRRQINLVQGHVIVCGFGRVGHVVCEELFENSKPFVVIDADEDRITEAVDRGYLAMRGDASDERVLQNAGIDRAESVVCVASTDTVNIVISLSAHHVCPNIPIFARAEHAPSVKKMRRAGATHVISPSLVSGRRIAQALIRPTAAALLDPDEDRPGRIKFGEIHIEAGSPLAGEVLSVIGAEYEHVVFVGIEHQGGAATPRPDPSQSLVEGDVLLVAGETEELVRFIGQAAPASKAA